MSLHDRCANQTCPKRDEKMGVLGLDTRWVQVEEKEIVTAGREPHAAIVRSRLSAVCCSRRCAAQYLMANVADEDTRVADESDFLKDWSTQG